MKANDKVTKNTRKTTTANKRVSKKANAEMVADKPARRHRTSPQVLDKPAGPVVLALGLKKFTVDQAVKVLLKFNPAESYVPNPRKFASDRLWRGLHGKGGRPAELSANELKRLSAIANSK